MNKSNGKIINFKDISKFKHPWAIKNDFLIFKKAEKDYQKYLFFLTKKLNYYFNKNFSVKFWEIILGEFIIGIIHIFYERLLFINKYKKKYKFQISSNTINIKTYEEFRLYSENIHEYIHNYILKHYKNKNFILSKQKKTSEELNSIDINKKNYKESIYKLFYGFRNSISGSTKNHYVIAPSTGLNRDNSFLKKFNIFYIDNKNKSTIDYLLRKKLSKCNQKKYDQKFINLIFKLMPISYLENFDYNYSQILKKYSSTKYLISKYLNDQVRFLSAYLIEKKRKIIRLQHGGNYWIYKYNFFTNFEVRNCTYYLPWGKYHNKNKKCIIFGYSNDLLISDKNFNIKKNKSKCLIFLDRGKQFHRAWNSGFFKNLDMKNNLNINLSPLLKKINNKDFKKNIVLRMHKSNEDFKKHIKENYSNYEISDYDKNLKRILDNSKITVHTYFSTSFVDTIISNIPSILITKIDTNVYNKFSKKILISLMKNHIVFESPTLLYKFIEKNWKNIDKWWHHKNTQLVRKDFLMNYCFENKNLNAHLSNLIKKTNLERRKSF